MATITYIPEKTQSKTAMGKVMRYCARKDKTACEVDNRQFQLISGKDCCGETAFKEFMATKQQYGKDNGMFFYQYVQSFSPDENITPQMAHEVGCKFAEYFKGHEVLIATHTDAEHIHTHFIINSVNFENGKKLQMASGSIHDLRQFSDEICRKYELSIVEPKENNLKDIRTREYRSAEKGESWKFQLMNVVDSAMKTSNNKVEFTEQMNKMGYGVKWQDNLKHITYTTPDGKKCRANKLHDDKYLKENMEAYYEQRKVKDAQQAGKLNRELPNTTTVLRTAARNSGAVTNNVSRDNTGTDTDAGAYIKTSDMAEFERGVPPCNDGKRQQTHQKSGDIGKTDYISVGDQNGQLEISSPQGYGESAEKHGEHTDSTGYVNRQTTPKMDGLGSVDLLDMLRIAKDIEALVNPYDPEKERQKQAQKPKKLKKYRKSHDWDMEL